MATYEKALTTTASVAQSQRFYVKNIIENGRMWLVHDFCAQQVRLEKGKGKTADFKRYAAFSLALAPLKEGTTPEGQAMTAVTISATAQQYGDWTAVTDVLSWTSEDPQITIATDLLGDQYGETIDTMYRDQLAGGTSYYYAGAVATRVAVITAISETDIAAVRGVILTAKGKFFNPLMKAGPGIGTSPIGPSFWMYSHTDGLSDLEVLASFVPVHKYPNPGAAAEYEVGYDKNVRILITQNAYKLADAGAAIGGSGLKTTSGVNIDVYFSTVFAKNAYGVVKADALNMEVIVEPIGSGGAADPLHQRGSVAWKTFQVLKILREDWMCRIEHGCKI